ncbi:dolichyl-phosphate-mannose-protein mannosyltransferase [Rhizobium sp. PP-F2F-G48]|uniref:glycosyltransferase family 39 protein n=1 Tax=Rhizobium sp. PP-F2F-G48 TaxID=2135651 RepID=UPI0010E1D2D4|nr:glycosyltransferase family 39 protein [Rhizobium sp. PP-F2F-G48]TCM53808.1 dolichyl-phosphate-mannose-protein mannosyltransferase [Rhizobium sp. PP-F2F-G48]
MRPLTRLLAADRSPLAIFPLVLTAYFALHVLVRLVLPTTLEHDEAQQVFVSQFLALGYDGQPPLYNWLQNLVFEIFGVSRAALSILKNGLLLATYLLTWMTARQLLQNRALAVVATLGLLTLPQLGFESQRDLTHTVAAFFSVALFFYALVRTVRHPSLPGYVLTGVAIGLGVISKYNIVLLPVAACLAMLLDRDVRRYVLDVRILATMATAALIVLPHAVWFLHNMEAATSTTLAKMTSDTSYFKAISMGIGSYLVAILGCVALTLLCFSLTFRRPLRAAIKAESNWMRLVERIFIIIAVALLLIILFGGVDSIRDRWLSPYTLVFPLYLCLKIEAAGADRPDAMEGFFRLAILFMVAIPTILLLRITTAGLTGEYQYINAPFEGLSRDIDARASSPSLFVAEETHVAGNLHLQRPDVPAAALTYPQFAPSFTLTQEHPIVLVWRERKGRTPPPMPSDLSDWLDRNTGPNARIERHTLTLPQLYGRAEDTYSFGYAIAYPH